MTSDALTKKEFEDKNANDQVTLESALLNVVQNKDIDPDRLEKFIDMQFRLEERQAEKDFNIAMAKFQGECPIINKTKRVNFKSVDYTYTPLDEIVHVIKPILMRHGLSYSFDIKEKDSSTHEMITTVLHSSGHQKKYSYFYMPLHDDNRMNQAQRSKSSVTFAKRAAIENAFGIVTQDEDDDAGRAIDTPISESQIEEIKELCVSTGTIMDQFTAYMKVDSIDKLSEYEAKKGINLLKQKRAK